MSLCADHALARHFSTRTLHARKLCDGVHFTLQSAGMTSPPLSEMTSPRHSSLTSISTHLPSRFTNVCGADKRCNNCNPKRRALQNHRLPCRSSGTAHAWPGVQRNTTSHAPPEQNHPPVWCTCTSAVILVMGVANDSTIASHSHVYVRSKEAPRKRHQIMNTWTHTVSDTHAASANCMSASMQAMTAQLPAHLGPYTTCSHPQRATTHREMRMACRRGACR